MNEIKGKTFTIRIPFDLAARLEKQRKKEGRSQAEFIRRVLDRYLLEQEFRGQSGSDVDVMAQESITNNKDLLKRLRNS